MMPYGLSLSPKTVATNGAKRCLRWKTIVSGSGVVTLRTSSYPWREITSLSRFMIAS
jgi:hypothetical protein